MLAKNEEKLADAKMLDYEITVLAASLVKTS